MELLDIHAHDPSVQHIPNSNHTASASFRAAHSTHPYAKLERLKLGSQHVYVLLQITEDGKTLKLQFIPLLKPSGSASSSYNPRLSSRPLHLVFDSTIIPDVFVTQDEVNQTFVCWVLTGNEDLHRIHLPAPDQIHMFTPTASSHSVQYLQSLNGRHPLTLKPVNSNSVSIACQDGSIVIASVQPLNRIMGNSTDLHLRELVETVLNKSSSLKRSSSLFDNLKNLVGQSDVKSQNTLPTPDACPVAIHSVSPANHGEWIVVLSQDGKMQIVPAQPSYDRQPLKIDWWKDSMELDHDEAEFTLLARGRCLMHSHALADGRFQILTLTETKKRAIIHSFIFGFDGRQPVYENGWTKPVGAIGDAQIVDFISQKSTVNGKDQTVLWVLLDSDGVAQIQHCLVDTADAKSGRWRKVDNKYDNPLPDESSIQQLVQSAVLESSMPHARALFSQMRLSASAVKEAFSTFESGNTQDTMMLDQGNDDLLSHVSDVVSRKVAGATNLDDAKREWRRFIDLCIHLETKLRVPIRLQTAGASDKTIVILKLGTLSILRQSDDVEILHCYGNQSSQNLIIPELELEQGELQHPQMSDIIARTSVLKMLDAISHLVQAISQPALQRIDDMFLDILKKPIRDTIDAFAHEFYQIALHPALSTMEDGDALVTQFLAEWKECPNASEAVHWLLEQLAAPDTENMIDEHDGLASRPSNFVDNLIISTFEQIISSRYQLSRNVMVALVLIFASNKTASHLSNATSLLAFSVATTTSGALVHWTIEHSLVSDMSPGLRPHQLLQKRDRPQSLLHLLVEMYSQVKIDENSSLVDLATTGSYNLIQSLGIFKRTTQVVTTVDMVRFANILEVYGFTNTALGFASMLNAGPGVFYVMGKCTLKNQKIMESVEYFERAAAGVVGSVSSDDQSYLPQLLPSDIVRDGLWRYYHHVADMYSSRSLTEQAAHFESLALQSLDSATETTETTALLQRKLFQRKLELGAFEEAYSLLMTSLDGHGKSEQAKQLVLVLCQKKQDKLLCKLAFDNFQSEVKSTLTKLAEVSAIAEMPRYWKLLYSYAVIRRDYSTGAFAMFMYAKRLSYNMADPASLREQVRAYLVAKNTLALRPSVDAHISVTVQPEFNHTQPPKVISVRVGDIEKELAMAKARLAASEANTNMDVQSVQIPEAIDTYISEKNWDEAFYVAELFSLDPRPILEAVITHCIYNMKSQSNRDRTWQPLKGYLEARTPDQNYKYYDFALEKMLEHGGTALPWWIVQHYEKYDPEALIRAYLRYGDTERATSFMIRRINKQNDHIQVSPTTSSRWMPYTLIDSILKDLKMDIQNVADQGTQRRLERLQQQLESALQTYFETIRRETNMLVNKPSVERAKRLRA